ncbi:hypothetical protein ACFLY9_01380 [Patescibacteria group bacterium]
MNFLKVQQYYSDLYDLFTVKECLRMEQVNRKLKIPKKIGKEKVSLEDSRKLYAYIAVLPLYTYKGERYRNKQDKINEWVDRDTKKQERFDSAVEPNTIFCEKCNEVMFTIDKILEDYMDESLKVLFLLECPKCHKRKGIYDDGSEFKKSSHKCPKCFTEMRHSSSRKGKIITSIYKCKSCNYTDTETFDLAKKDDKWEKEQKTDRRLLARYRSDYCLSDEDGNEYITSVDQIKRFLDQRSEEQKKEADPIYQKVKKVKRLTVVELEKLLSKALGKDKYIKLSFDKPEIGRQVIVPFTVQDSDSQRESQDSTYTLQKVIKSTIKGSNWRLMSEGTTYRLGYVSGRLKGYEDEDDLYKLVKSSKS